jgi:hypothetical protein
MNVERYASIDSAQGERPRLEIALIFSFIINVFKREKV